MTKAPPAPSRPATKAPANPSARSVTANARVTPSAEQATAALEPRDGRWRLPDARPVRRQVGELLVGNRRHQRLDHLELSVARAPLVRLEEQHLVLEITGRLTRQIGNAFRRITLARGAVAERALRGRLAPALDGPGIGRHRRRRALLCGEVGGDVVEAELDDLLGVGLHFRRRALAGSEVLDSLLEVPGRHAGEDWHRIRLALAGESVARAADHRGGGARAVERSGCSRAGEGEEQQADENDRHHVVPFYSVHRRASAGGAPAPPRLAARTTLAEHVLPDAVGPSDRVLRPHLGLAGRELLLDLHDLAAL